MRLTTATSPCGPHPAMHNPLTRRGPQASFGSSPSTKTLGPGPRPVSSVPRGLVTPFPLLTACPPRSSLAP